MSVRIGMICRSDSVGLGTLSWEFARHLKPHKVLMIHNDLHLSHPYRFDGLDVRDGNKMSPMDLDWFLKDIDVFFTIETPYNWNIIKECRKRGIKTVLYTMFEMTQDPIPLGFDLYICPSKLDMKYFPAENSVFLPPPVATDRLLWTRRERANHFTHIGSHGGVGLRKGTPLLLEAMKYVKSDIKLTIFTWKPFFKSDDPRVIIEVVNFKNYWQAYREGDCMIYMQGANGICLPIIEAMASGMAVITTDLYPFNEYMPKELLVKPDKFVKRRFGSRLMEVDDPIIDPKKVAEKIDEIAGQSIVKFSKYGKAWAEKNSWEVLLPKYLKVFEDLCKK